MIETIERRGLEAPSEATRSERPSRTRRRSRGWLWLLAAMLIVAGGAAIGVAMTRPTTSAPIPVDRGHSRFHQLPAQVTTTDGSRIDLSDQAFRYGLVQLTEPAPTVPATSPGLDRVKQDELRREANTTPLAGHGGARQPRTGGEPALTQVNGPR